jgi:OOP family OmpA-OmpF porin
MRTLSRRHALAAVAALGFFAGRPTRAHAQAAPGFALNRFEPSERGSEWFVNDPLDLRGKVRPALGIVADYGYKPYVLLNPDGSENTSVVSSQLFLHVGGSLVLIDRVRLAVSLPIALAQSGDDGPRAVGGQLIAAPTRGGVGDLRLAADVRVLGEYGSPFTLAGGLRAWLPTGDQAQYLGDDGVRIGPHASVAGDVGRFAYAASLGFTYRAHDQPFAGHATGSQVDFGIAGGLRALDRRLLIGPELWGSTIVSNSDAVFGGRTTPLALLLSGHYSAGDVRVGLGMGPGLSAAAGTAAFRVVASLEYAPGVRAPTEAPSDRDGDGIVDGADACPDVVGVKTGDPKTNGCPADRDGDAIVDAADACPDVAGVKTDDPKTNGCPPPNDRDGDRIADDVDACPDVAGVKTDDPKTNGCPPPDRDKDGVADATDACPDVAGVKTDDPKTNGCPPDRDADAIPDGDDACPDAPGPRNADPKKNGCPAVRIEAGQVKILEQIKFKTGSAEILKESQPIIDAVAKVVREHAEIKRLRVEGHTDNKGAAKLNKDLSGKRAASVAAALVKAGVETDRLASEGFGMERPIDVNATEAGRANNRRVEFHIEEPEKK